MSKIKVMNDFLANKIAAGEVVERISSVVKELVENAVDAHATDIRIELVDSGKKNIRVIDDGIGMDKQDAINCFLRHATSKLYKDDDLFFINTLGFRGEALPSIAAVSEVVLETFDGQNGTMIHIKGGETLEVGIAPSRKGTILSVSNLFYNTPARLKYLKSEPTELANVIQFIEKLSLSYPKISFTLQNNGKICVRTTGSGDLLKVIYEIYGREISSNMIEIKSSNDDYDIYGFISKPIIQRSNRNFMNTIVNGRLVKNIELNRIINEAYHTYKPDTVYPVVVVNIETDPTLIDVNIHPTKQDIKFSKMDELRNILIDSIKNALYSTMLVASPVNNIEASDYSLEEELPRTLFVKEEEEKYEKVKKNCSENLEEQGFQESIDLYPADKNESIKRLELYPVGIAHGTYIICENEEGVFLIDQHAAVERINYEKVLKGIDKKDTEMLLVPIVIELSKSETEIIKSKEHILTDMGFLLEEFGFNTYRVNGHPTWVKKGVEVETIRTILDLLVEYQNFDAVKFNDNLAATIACKKSLKGNTRITLDLASEIIKNLVLCDNPYNCPHGRPTIIKFTKYELEKMFKRAM